MYYVLDICPKCKDRLYEREQTEEKYFASVAKAHCSKCGHRLIMACTGEKKPDDAVYNTIHKIFLTYFASESRNREKCIDIVMKQGHCDRKTAIEKLSTESSVICEGNLCETYLSIHELDETEGDICYRVEPEFPYSRQDPWVWFCPTCEGIPVKKTEVMASNPDLVYMGTFCEKCNEWVEALIVSKEEIEDM